ncbi:hypothetical protein CERSUDRAFT_87698 [Gelatoporia subvermispora B]|uniref:Uncharacterized protein n=1 Tax=Ceriporiopsis subvermispora (strain B) TaxID=914234 RepID=M2R292_CERS8|nr:hypothetical protein CERSUDRAFT_87698 [Gelatoporia subvermispora B]
MTISAHKREREESVEEIRVQDYLQAYTTTGRPPAPCPQLPAGARERAALGLPPLFEPFVTSPTTSSTPPFPPGSPAQQAQVNGHVPPQTNSPDVQVFVPLRVAGEQGQPAWYAQSLNFQPQYAAFSFEELRLQAYIKGLKGPISGQASTPAPSSTPAAQPAQTEEKILSICASPPFAQHSFEELRLAYLRAGRPMTSPEILRAGWPTVV